MKVNGNGKAAVLSPVQLKTLFKYGFKCPRDRALFGIMFYTGCRVSEALHLKCADVFVTHIVFRKSITKGKLDTREVPISPDLAAILCDYKPRGVFMFPGSSYDVETLSRSTADRIIRSAFERLKIKGASTHSFRRTALTTMHNAGVPLGVIQKVSGHRKLEQLARYLEVSDEQLYQAALTLKF